MKEGMEGGIEGGMKERIDRRTEG